MAAHIFQRKLYSKMLEWKTMSNGSSALLVEGARRVGKSTLVNQFAKKEYKSAIVIDFNMAPRHIIALFDDYSDLDTLFLNLQAHYHVSLHKRQSVIVFDEVQQCPRARQAIKYLVQDGRYDYIETGSLIRLHKNTKDITIPSEEHHVTLHPLDYEEFLWALGDTTTMSLIRQQFDVRRGFGQTHRSLMRDLRLYMLVGGMPQAVKTYLETNNLSQVDTIRREILTLYTEDFRKIDATGRISRLFNAIPAQLSKNAKRYIPSSVIGEVSEHRLAEMLAQMEDSQVVRLAYHANDPNVGMSLSANYDYYKMFLCDTGLFVTLAFWDKDYTENTIYTQLLSDKFAANLGYVYENLVAQMLVAAGNRLFYFTFAKDDKHYYEIDFLLSRGKKICPIEVKSSNYRTHTSIDQFIDRFSERVGTPYILHTKDSTHENALQCLPVYMTGLL